MNALSNKDFFHNFTDSLPVSVILYDDEKIVYLNNQAVKALKGTLKSDFIGKSFWDFVAPEHYRAVARVIKKFTEEDESSKLTEEKFVCLDNSIIDVEVAGSMVDYDGKRSVQVVFTDISERKKVEKALFFALEEKEILVKEINHKIKNTIQLIISLLNLQLSGIKDAEDKEIYKSSINRIYAMSLVHQKIQQSGSYSEINFNNYIQEFVSGLLYSSPDKRKSIKIDFDVKDIFLNMDKAVTCAIIINEIVSNSIKYAFPDEREGNITIHFYEEQNDTFSLSVFDNGIGFSWSEGDFSEIKTLGFKLIDSLVNQLDGTLNVISGENWGYSINFPK